MSSRDILHFCYTVCSDQIWRCGWKLYSHMWAIADEALGDVTPPTNSYTLLDMNPVAAF